MICKIRVALLGFMRGHKWRRISPTTGHTSTALYCVRCGENGWML